VPSAPLEHLLKRSEFLAVAKAGKRYVTPAFIIQAYPRESAGSLRYGVVATRKIGGSVERNRAKRRLRALAKAVLLIHGHKGFDYVFIARDDILTRNFALMGQDLETALSHLHKLT
jgi:ribonuclease P protein component